MKRLTTISLMMIGLLGLMFSSTTFAASECKGKNQAVCKAASSCAWVEAYKRKDGAKVKAHCKSKPSKKDVKDKAKAKKDKVKTKVKDKKSKASDKAQAEKDKLKSKVN